MTHPGHPLRAALFWLAVAVAAMAAMPLLAVGQTPTETPTDTPTPHGTPFTFCLSGTPTPDNAESVGAADTNYCPTAVATPALSTLIAQRSDTGGGNFVVTTALVRWLTGPTLANKQVTFVTLSGTCNTVTITDTGDTVGSDYFSWTPATEQSCYSCENPDIVPCGCGAFNSAAASPCNAPGPFTQVGESAAFNCVNVNTGDGFTGIGFQMHCQGQHPTPGPDCDGTENPPSGVNQIAFAADNTMCLHVWAVDVTPTPTLTPTITPRSTGCCGITGVSGATCGDGGVFMGPPPQSSAECLDLLDGFFDGNFNPDSNCVPPGDVSGVCPASGPTSTAGPSATPTPTCNTISFHAVKVVSGTGSTASVVLGSEVTPGDMLVMQQVTENVAGGPDPSDGWVSIGIIGIPSPLRRNYVATLSNASPGTYNFTFSAPTEYTIAIASYSGAGSTDGDTFLFVNPSTTLTADSITTTTNNDYLIAAFMAIVNPETWTPPPGMAERYAQDAGTVIPRSLELSDQAFPTAGVTGNRDAIVGTASAATTLLLALAPQCGPFPTPTPTETPVDTDTPTATPTPSPTNIIVIGFTCPTPPCDSPELDGYQTGGKSVRIENPNGSTVVGLCRVVKNTTTKVVVGDPVTTSGKIEYITWCDQHSIRITSGSGPVDAQLETDP